MPHIEIAIAAAVTLRDATSEGLTDEYGYGDQVNNTVVVQTYDEDGMVAERYRLTITAERIE